MYKPKKQGKKVDALTRCSHDLSKEIHDFKEQHQYQTLLQKKNLNENIKKTLSALFYENETKNEKKKETSEASSTGKSEINIENFSTFKKQFNKSKENFFQKAYEQNKIVQNIIAAKRKKLRKLSSNLIKKNSNFQ